MSALSRTLTIHVVPIDDLIEHQVPDTGGPLHGLTDTAKRWLRIPTRAKDGHDHCVCGPRGTVCDGCDDSDGDKHVLYEHHSLDGREHREQDEEAAP